MFIDDCVEGTQKIMNSSIAEPLNLGSNELVTINQHVDIVEEIAGVRLKLTCNPSAPKRVNSRNSDNSMILNCLGWQPSIRLRDGMEKTYRWIEHQIAEKSASRDVALIEALSG
jgi:GDP-D-mannose 3', 5'-epimerase